MKIDALRIYYLATPLFLILHYYFDLNLRVSIPGMPGGWILGYYFVCFAGGFVAFKSNVTGALFSLVESSVNILLLMLSILLPIYTIGSNPAEGIDFSFGTAELFHFLIVGSILLRSFYMNPLLTRQR